MAKYFSPIVGGSGGPFDDACSTAAGSDGAVAYDPPTLDPALTIHLAKMCWKIAGRAVIIDDTYMSMHAGFEMANFNFHVDGYQPAVPNQFSFPVSMVA